MLDETPIDKSAITDESFDSTAGTDPTGTEGGANTPPSTEQMLAAMQDPEFVRMLALQHGLLSAEQPQQTQQQPEPASAGQTEEEELPDFFDNPDLYVQKVVQKTSAPLQAKIDALEALRAEQELELEITKLEKDVPNARQLIQQIDTRMPAMKAAPPEVKVMVALGAIAKQNMAKTKTQKHDEFAPAGRGTTFAAVPGGSAPKPGAKPVHEMSAAEFDKSF